MAVHSQAITIAISLSTGCCIPGTLHMRNKQVCMYVSCEQPDAEPVHFSRCIVWCCFTGERSGVQSGQLDRATVLASLIAHVSTVQVIDHVGRVAAP
jgi:hypothetical protein